jgi:hypothetical protein
MRIDRIRYICLGTLTITLALGSFACGSSPTTPSPTPSPGPSPAPVATVTRVRVSGNTALTAIGETTQLKAIADYSDGTTRDVTTEAIWNSTKPANFIVASGGIVTVVNFGLTTINAILQPRTGFIQVTATPPNTFVFYGRVREPGNSGIANVQVLDTESKRTAMTSQFGEYEFANLRDARFRMEKDGFETVEVKGTPFPAFVDIPMQRFIRFAAGGSVSTEIAPNDLSYDIGTDRCFPCKRIRVTVPTAGTLHLAATQPIVTATGLNIWVNNARFGPAGSSVRADVPVTAGELFVYVGGFGSTSGYVPFTFTTSLTSS